EDRAHQVLVGPHASGDAVHDHADPQVVHELLLSGDWPRHERRKRRPSVAIASWDAASGRQMDAALAIASFSPVKLSMETAPPYPIAARAPASAGQSMWSAPGAPRSFAHAWRWKRRGPAARTAAARSRSSMSMWYVSSSRPPA